MLKHIKLNIMLKSKMAFRRRPKWLICICVIHDSFLEVRLVNFVDLKNEDFSIRFSLLWLTYWEWYCSVFVSSSIRPGALVAKSYHSFWHSFGRELSGFRGHRLLMFDWTRLPNDYTNPLIVVLAVLYP